MERRYLHRLVAGGALTLSLSLTAIAIAIAIAIAFSIAIPIATAAELRDVNVEREDDRYSLRSETLFDAERKDLYRVLSDYDHFEKFTSAFIESRNLEPDEEGRPRFHTVMEGCVLFFCIDFVRYGHLVLDPERRIEAVVDPETSDFKYSVESWTLSDVDDQVLMVYEFEMEPDFWVPPIIGPYYIRRALEDGAVRAIDRIEAVAQGREPKYPVER